MASACMRRRITLALFGIIAPSLLWGCAAIDGELRAEGSRPKPDQLLAGAAKADLTPPPGYPMGGYSVAGKIGRGFWTRLWARAIYLEDEYGRSALLVSCDLWAIPGGLRDRVVEELQKRPETAHLASEEVLIAATHTHHSPGNFSTHDIYNENASPRVGFSEELFDFLVARITEAARSAVEQARPARAKWGETRLTGVGRNRSLDAFRLNGDRDQIVGLDYAASPDEEVSEEHRAVDRRLTALVLEDLDEESLIGIAAVLAVHNTALDVSTEVYHGDLFGLTSDRLETDWAGEGTSDGPVVAIFNGAEGDVSPATRERDRKDVLRLVERIATGIAELREVAEDIDVDIDARLDIVDLRDQELEDVDGRRWRTDDRPLPGVAQLGGAEDGRTFLYELGFQEGIRSDRRSETQGAKHGALDVRFDPDQLGLLRHGLRFVQWLIYPGRSDVPNEVPVAWIRTGPMVWVGLPGEPTTMVGHRVERAVKDALGDLPVRSIRTVGLANEYVSYLTTPEEYDAQHYEGASTLYGPGTAPLLIETVRCLTTKTPAPDIREFAYTPGSTRSFSPMEAGTSRNDPFAGLDAILETVTGDVHPSRLPRFTWRDRSPDLEHQPSVTLLGRDTPSGDWTTIADDAGPELLLVLLACNDTEALWTAIWVTAPIGAMPWLAMELEVRKASGEVSRLRPVASQ